MLKAADIMEPARATVHTDHPLREARVRLERFHTDTLIVLDGDEVIGTLHRRQLDACTEPEQEDHPVCDYVSPVAVTCAPSDEAAQIRNIFRADKHLSLILVVDDRRCLKGVIFCNALSQIGSHSARGTPDASIPQDPAGGHAPSARPGELNVYSDLPHIETRHIRK